MQAKSSLTFHHLELYSWFSDGSEGRRLPVGLLCLFPHHHVEGGRVLVTEDEASVVIVRHRIHMERSVKVNSAERCVACKRKLIKRNNGFFSQDNLYLPTASPGSEFMV